MTTPQDFKTAYQILQNNVKLLEQSDEPDIDELMQIVEESINAYKVCQSRITAVETALQQAFEQS